MNASDVDCQVIVGLAGSWLDGSLGDGDREAYEEHMVLCPPCLTYLDNARIALAALPAAATVAASDDLVSQLVDLVSARVRQAT